MSDAKLCLLCLTLCSPPLFAQSPVDPLDQIIVTGSRAALPLKDLGSAVTVLTRDDIERQQSRYVTDLLRAVPGFAVSHSGVAGSQTQVRVRGSEANQVLVLIDGIRANDPTAGDEFRWEFLTTDNIERIEIVRGPQSSLWGSDAIAAVVQVITRTGKQSPGVGGYVEAGTNNTLNGALRGGYASEQWSMAMDVERLSTDGDNIALVGDESDDSEITTMSVSSTLRPSDSIVLNLGVRATDAYSQFDTIDYVETGLPADSNVATDGRQDFAQLGASLGAVDSRVRHHFNARYYGSDYSNLVEYAEESATTSDRLTFSYQADIRIAANLLSLALEHESTDFSQRGNADFGDPNQNQEIEVSSVIGDFQGHPSEKLTWLLSARYDDNSEFDNAFTGRLSVAYQWSEATLLRANVGTGQKNPTFIERFGYYPSQFVGNPALKPELSTSIDVGIDQQIGDSLFLQLSLYTQNLKDEINGFVWDPATFLATSINMDGTSQRRGVEFGGRWRISDRVEIDASYSYNDSVEEDITGTDVRELRRPRHSGSVTLDLHLLEDRGRLTLVADYGGTRSDVFYPPWPQPSQLVALPSYWLLDLTAQYDVSPAITLFARAANLLDTEYQQVYGYRTPGLHTYAGMQVNFGD